MVKKKNPNSKTAAPGKEKTEAITVAAGMPQVKKNISRRGIMLGLSAVMTSIGIGGFILYVFTVNMIIGAPAVLIGVVGFFLLMHYWKKQEDIYTEHIGGPTKKQVNSLSIYPQKVVFEDVSKPEGFPWECENDHKKYYVYIWDTIKHKLVPLLLPDQQYIDPEVFAQRVLELPAHRKIFRRKQTVFDKLKTGFLVLAIGILFVLILTTTGG